MSVQIQAQVPEPAVRNVLLLATDVTHSVRSKTSSVKPGITGARSLKLF